MLRFIPLGRTPRHAQSQTAALETRKAARQGPRISLKTVGREVDRALDQRRLDGVDRHLRLQIERLNKALRAIDCALEFGDAGAVGPLLKVIEKLDRYHGLGAARRAGAEPSPKRLDAQASPLALTHERTENSA